jgi:hypothetical protein
MFVADDENTTYRPSDDIEGLVDCSLPDFAGEPSDTLNISICATPGRAWAD